MITGSVVKFVEGVFVGMAWRSTRLRPRSGSGFPNNLVTNNFVSSTNRTFLKFCFFYFFSSLSFFVFLGLQHTFTMSVNLVVQILQCTASGPSYRPIKVNKDVWTFDCTAIDHSDAPLKVWSTRPLTPTFQDHYVVYCLVVETYRVTEFCLYNFWQSISTPHKYILCRLKILVHVTILIWWKKILYRKIYKILYIRYGSYLIDIN